MPSIKITEIDETTGGVYAASIEVVYVPGFMSMEKASAWDTTGKTDNEIRDIYANIAKKNTPTLCRTKDEFKEKFGSKPYTFTENITYGAITGDTTDTEIFIHAGDKDKSYIYAMELLDLGMQVLYESFNHCDDVKPANEADLITTLYSTMSASYEELKDKSEYDVKYLTSGGYPTLEMGSTGETSTPITIYTLTRDTQPQAGKKYYTRKPDGSYDEVEDIKAFTGEIFYTIETTDASGALLKITEEEAIKLYVELNGAVTPITAADLTDEALAGENALFTKVDEDEYAFKAGYTYLNVADTKIDYYEAREEIKTVSGANTLATAMVSTAETRGDCVALIDHTNKPDRILKGEGSAHKMIVDFAKTLTADEFAAAFTPWVKINCASVKDEVDMPPSFAYLAALAYSIKTNASWLAVAGATRGQVPNLVNLCVESPLTNSIAESEYQNRDGVSINAVTNIRPFGYRIWGNRTLKDNSTEGNLTATSFLNIRNLVSDVKKVVYKACKQYMFEQNTDILWTNFKAKIEPTLEQMRTGGGLSGYKIIKEATKEKAKLVAKIKLYPIYAVEDFEITVSMNDEEVSVS